MKSEKMAKSSGFSSLQEVVRLFLFKYSNNELEVGFEIPQIKLSTKNDQRYTKMIDDYNRNKNVVRSRSVDDFFAKLNSDKNSLSPEVSKKLSKKDSG